MTPVSRTEDEGSAWGRLSRSQAGGHWVGIPCSWMNGPRVEGLIFLRFSLPNWMGLDTGFILCACNVFSTRTEFFHVNNLKPFFFFNWMIRSAWRWAVL